MPAKRSTSLEHAQIDQTVTDDSEVELSKSGVTATDSPQSQTSEWKYKPDWLIWQDRPVASVQEAICLLHDIHPPAYSKLDADDARNKYFRPHLKTLKQRITYVQGIRIAPGEDYECKSGDGTYIVLRDFVEQVRTGALFKGFNFPEEFSELNPPLPFEFEEDTCASSFSGESAQVPKPAENSNERLNKAWARLLVLMAIEHYKFIPDWPPEKSSDSVKGSGLYQPLADISKENGVSYLGDRGTVQNAFVTAVQRLGEEEVKKIRAKLEENAKSAQSSPAAHT
ncbi:hypothetical protein [Comamonas sp. 26]|uniref:hypothetical protein n=1 Tax=Comamonas sp. 26 TaxID=2035201 RepID=UPI000C5D03F6|nr:hypothetical protein [Comamonas sp. 26]PIG00379.1 hypothetical protein CLU84_3356 [Comamonas sp. 26]